MISQLMKGGDIMSEITQIISAVGFPIVMCLALMWYVKEISISHKEETGRFVEALNKNTIVLQKLCDKLDTEMEEE